MHYLHVDSLTKTQNGVPLLNNLFISCKTGDVIALLGRNGTGKSTLLKIIFGSVKADFKFQKINTKIVKNGTLQHRRIQYLPQSNFLPKNATIKKLLTVMCAKSEVKKLYTNPHIAPYLSSQVKELSGGELRIIEVLMILNTEAAFILLDEPFNGISPINVKTISDAIREKSAFKGIVITDHNYELVLELADSIRVLKNGSLLKLKDQNQLREYGYIY